MKKLLKKMNKPLKWFAKYENRIELYDANRNGRMLLGIALIYASIFLLIYLEHSYL
tara:strand:- start:87 stop:254 length:168 start_codon:yes stop_codon:yes gene_type:complete